jgi:RimJ/RimL family protein N-acetyltransferase
VTAHPIDVPERLPAGAAVLRPLRAEDAAAYARAFIDDPQLGVLLGVESDPLEGDAREHIHQQPGRAASGLGLELAIAGVDDDAFLGTLTIHTVVWQHGRCELGFWLTAAARGRGVATQAVSAALRWAFDMLALQRVEVTTTSDNPTVPELVRRLGFTREGMLRRHNVERGRRVDIVCFGLLAAEWRAPRQAAGSS